MEYYGIHYDSVIEHHGILGMKWGVRRYQNTDGTLTAKGKKRYAKVASSPRLQRTETMTARSMAKRSAKVATKTAKKFESAAVKQRSKAEMTTDPSKAAKHREAAKRNFRLANVWNKQAKYAKRYMSDLDSGKKKAGRDFITQTDYYFNPIIIPGVGAGVGFRSESKIIERK